MIDLERSLGEFAQRLEIPGGEWLADDVVRRIAAPSPSPSHTPRRVVRFGVALAALVAISLIVLPGPRRVVARWLGFDSVRIEPGVTVPTAAPVAVSSATTVASVAPVVPAPTSPATAVPSTTAVVASIDLGPSLSLEAALARTGLPDPTPTLLGAPQSIHVVEPPAAGQVVLVFAPSDLVPQSTVTGVGALVSVLPATIVEGYFRKTLGDQATVRSVDVGGARGYWIEGSPHQLLFQFGNETLTDTLRLATNTLLWQRSGVVYRIEAEISLETALKIAAAVGGGT
jgi:hypothetical protein